MSKTHHSTTHPTTGQVATRTSENRVYTHAVWVRYTEQQAEANVRKNAAYIKSGFHGRHALTGEEAEREIAHWIAYHQKQVEKGWGCNKWCSRHDLAQKTASALRSQGYDVIVTEAVVTKAKVSK